MALSWVAVEARTGRVITDLPLLDVKRVGAILGTYTTTTGTLPIPEAPVDWLRATEPEASYLILVDDAQSVTDPTPIWGGRVTQRRRGLGDTANLSLASFESYLDRRYVRDVTYTATEQTAIAADLVDRFVQDGSTPLEVVASGAGTLRDREYRDDQDKTVLSALQELSAVQGGIEFTVTWKWLHDPERIVPVLTIADRVGSPVPTGLGPNATFEAGLTEVEFFEDWSAGAGANDVMASSSGVGDARPQSPHQVAPDDLRPTLEYRFTPSTSITEISTLTAHAQRVLASMRTGTMALSLSAVTSQAPRLGTDWGIGDDVGYRIGGIVASGDKVLVRDAYTDTYADQYGNVALVPKYPNGRDLVPAFPGGLGGTARCIGWDLDLAEPQTVTPILELGGAQ